MAGRPLNTRSGFASLLRSVRLALSPHFLRKRAPAPPASSAPQDATPGAASGRPWPRPGVAQPGLGRCLLLALLLHILLFIVVGTAPGGDSPAGRRAPGDLVVYMPEARASRRAEARASGM